MRYAQGIGRGLRYYNGITTLIFDHSGTSIDLGMPEDISIDALRCKDDGESESKKAKDDEIKAIKKPKLCPSCQFLKPAGIYECPKCGFKPVVGEDVETDESRGLTKVSGKKKTFTKEDKQSFWSELKGYQKEYKYPDGRIAHLYKEKFGVWPRLLKDTPKQPGLDVRNYIKSRNIAYAKGKQNENKRSNAGS